MQPHGVAPEVIDGRLLVETGRGRELTTAPQGRDGVQNLKPVTDGLRREIEARGIDVLVVRSFPRTARPKTATAQSTPLQRKLGRLADRCDCAIELVHHAHKTNGEEAATESGRGADALLAAARSGRVLNKMGDDTKQEAGVQDDPATGVAVTRDKANLAPAGQCISRRMASVALARRWSHATAATPKGQPAVRW